MIGNEYGKNLDCPICDGGIPNDQRKGEYVGALSRFDIRLRCVAPVERWKPLWIGLLEKSGNESQSERTGRTGR